MKQPSGSDTDKIKILIVDDEPTSLILLKKIFGSAYSLFEAGNGVEALEILRANPDISAVILDLYMPLLDGFGVLQVMQRDEALRRIPVIINTADDGASKEKALALGAVDVITKPYNPQTVRLRVDRLISLMRAAKASEESRWISEIIRASQIDPRTGIYNKQTFCAKAAELIAASPDKKFVLARWDIDRFKVYNDSFGTVEGDRLLASIGEQLIAQRAKPFMAGELVYGHWDADHFVSLWDLSLLDPALLCRDTSELLNGIAQNCSLSVRFGYYLIEAPALDIGVACDRAYMALRSVKNSYDVRFAWYSASMRSEVLAEQEIVSEMQSALSGGQFVLYFQPQYNYDTGSMVGAEALVRWKHPTKGLISPAKFIPVFEKNGFIFELDKYVWDRACGYISEWSKKGLKVPDISISVNISRFDVKQPLFLDAFRELIAKYPRESAMLKLEITESAYMENPEHLISVVSVLKEMGFSVEMDDFGSGYSSLNMLKDVPVDILKLDMRFLSGGNESRGGNILTSIVRMAHSINISVIAEGVETKQKADFLKSIGCSYMQGFLFKGPVCAEEFEALLADIDI